jgi:hypothetical protein
VTDTVTSCITISEVALEGKLTDRPDGVIKEEVSIKNISNKKMMSVIEDMLNAASTLFFCCNPIPISLEEGQ